MGQPERGQGRRIFRRLKWGDRLERDWEKNHEEKSWSKNRRLFEDVSAVTRSSTASFLRWAEGRGGSVTASYSGCTIYGQ